MPDRTARRRLLEIYRGAAPLEVADLDAVVEPYEGVTASFLKEVLRRAALLALESTPTGDRSAVTGIHLSSALDDLLAVQARMTKTTLGG